MAVALMALIAPAASHGQTDYYNTDRGRPLRVEDAYPVERRAFEIQAAPFRLERATGGVYHWSIEPEIAYGILPRTQIELGVPIAFIDGAGGGRVRTGVAGVDVSVLHNLNVETSIPALALAARALLPVGELAPAGPELSVTGIATRTFRWARVHVNGEYTLGDEPTALSDASVEATRWTAGLAVDRTFPLQSFLVGAEILVQQPLVESGDVFLSATAGTRYQLTPRWAVDGGIGRRFTGDERAWFVTFGSAYVFGFPWSPRGAR